MMIVIINNEVAQEKNISSNNTPNANLTSDLFLLLAINSLQISNLLFRNISSQKGLKSL